MKKLILGIALFLAACDCNLHDEAFDLAGNGATDCGLVALGASAGPAFACALAAIDEQRAFVLRIERQGKDSHAAEAWVGQKDGDVFLLRYDGDPSGGGGDGNPRIERSTCRGPLRRTVTEDDVANRSFSFAVAAGDEVIACSELVDGGAICGD